MLSVVVTGASSGIGRQISQTLVANGYRVFGSVRKASDGEAVAADLGGNFVPLQQDSKQNCLLLKLSKKDLNSL